MLTTPPIWNFYKKMFLQCLPYLIAMGTDPDPAMRNKADQQLVDIDKKYSGFIHVSRVGGVHPAAPSSTLNMAW